MPTDVFKYHQRILDILRTTPSARDNDVVLYATLIKGPPFFYDLEKHTAKELLTDIYQHTLPHLESVRRTRQKIQEDNPSVQGTVRKLRKEKEKEWRSEINAGLPNGTGELFVAPGSRR